MTTIVVEARLGVEGIRCGRVDSTDVRRPLDAAV
jgi:hypothetical protein